MSESSRGVRILVVCNLVSLLLALGFGAYAFAGRSHLRVAELDAERINVLGTNGRPVLVLANRRTIPGPSMNGKDYPPAVADGREYVSGMIFFNEQGDEVGGLIFNGFPKGEGYSSVGHLSFDQWKQNQVVALQYIDSGSTRRAGLNVWDRPTDVPLDRELDRLAQGLEGSDAERATLQAEAAAAQARGEYGVQRLFLGSQDRTAQLALRDTQGRVRVKLYVDAQDEARLEFLDGAGEVVLSLP